MPPASRKTPLTPVHLSLEAYQPFGEYRRLLGPAGPKIGAPPIEFFRDQLQLPGGPAPVSFSICRIEPRQYVVDVLEYHSACAEALLPLDGDILLHVAPASATAEPPLGGLRVFQVPEGTLCTLRAGVWHHAPFTAGLGPVHVLIVLPERTYANDCVVRELAPAQQRQINWPPRRG